MSMIVNTQSKRWEYQSHRKYPENWNGDGWLPVPPALETKVMESAPYCELVISDGVLVDVMPTERPAPDLAPIKEQRIAQSKTDLETYLLEHPMLWTDGEYYAITAEKQNQLTSKIMAATMAQTMSTDYTLTWNSTGEVCKEWALPDLYALAFAIDARVTALVTYQQTKEVAMRNAETMEELEAITVNYDEVV